MTKRLGSRRILKKIKNICAKVSKIYESYSSSISISYSVSSLSNGI